MKGKISRLLKKIPGLLKKFPGLLKKIPGWMDQMLEIYTTVTISMLLSMTRNSQKSISRAVSRSIMPHMTMVQIGLVFNSLEISTLARLGKTTLSITSIFILILLM